MGHLSSNVYPMRIDRVTINLFTACILVASADTKASVTRLRWQRFEVVMARAEVLMEMPSPAPDDRKPWLKSAPLCLERLYVSINKQKQTNKNVAPDAGGI